MKIILIGMKACGKTNVGSLLASKLKIRFIELDDELEKEHQKLKNEHLTFRKIFKKYGEKYFRQLETETLLKLSKNLDTANFVFACGGGTPLLAKNQAILKKLGKIIYLKVDSDVLLQRIIKDGIPAFFADPANPQQSLVELLKKREPIYHKLADILIKLDKETPEEVIDKIMQLHNFVQNDDLERDV